MSQHYVLLTAEREKTTRSAIDKRGYAAKLTQGCIDTHHKEQKFTEAVLS
jgi:hypothetical protein